MKKVCHKSICTKKNVLSCVYAIFVVILWREKIKPFKWQKRYSYSLAC